MMVQLRDRTGRNIHLAKRNMVAVAASLGERFARIDGRRDFVQPTGPDDHEWSQLDETINACVEFGLEPYLCLNTTPAWDSRNGKGNGPPIEPIHWIAFVDAAGRRYRGKVHYWGWVNEPDGKGGWDGTVAEYVDRIAIPGYQVLKSINPTNQIAIPDTSTQGSSWPAWLESCLKRAHGHFDIVAVHSYAPRGRDVLKTLFEPKPWWNPFAHLSVFQIMQRAGCVHLPLALTEYGASSTRIGEDGQARMYDEFFEALEKEPRLAAAVGYALDEEGYGVFRADHSPKPAAEVIMRWLKPPVV